MKYHAIPEVRTRAVVACVHLIPLNHPLACSYTVPIFQINYIIVLLFLFVLTMG